MKGVLFINIVYRIISGKVLQVPVIIMLLLPVMGPAVKSDGGGGVGPALNVRGGIKGHYKYTPFGGTLH